MAEEPAEMGSQFASDHLHLMKFMHPEPVDGHFEIAQSSGADAVDEGEFCRFSTKVDGVLCCLDQDAEAQPL